MRSPRMPSTLSSVTVRTTEQYRMEPSWEHPDSSTVGSDATVLGGPLLDVVSWVVNTVLSMELPM